MNKRHYSTSEYKYFDFWDTGSRIQLCYESAIEKLRTLYPDKSIDSCDCFGLYVLNEDDYPLMQYSTGRTDDGTLAIRDETTKEVFPLY